MGRSGGLTVSDRVTMPTAYTSTQRPLAATVRSPLALFHHPPYSNHLPWASHCVWTCPNMAGDQRSPWPLTLAHSSPFGGPVRHLRAGAEGGVGRCWMWVVSCHGSVPLWQVHFLIGSEASGRLENSQYCPVWPERPSAERRGQDGSDWPQRSVAFQMPSIPFFSLVISSARRTPIHGQLQKIMSFWMGILC